MTMSRLTRFLGAFALLVGLSQAPAYASLMWSWDYSDGSNAGSGTLTTDDLSGGSYLITAISGTWNGNNITGLLAPGTCCFPPNNNNLLLDAVPQLDLEGFAFSVSGGPSQNIFYDGVAYAVVDSNQDFTRDGSFSAQQVPEPITLALVGIGFAGLGLSRRRHAATCSMLGA
jgi:hypothetical protein